MIIKLSKIQWEFIGHLAGWLKVSHVNFSQLSYEEYNSRLKKLGWTVKYTESGHYKLMPPVVPPGGERRFPLGFSPNNWEKNWRRVMKDLTASYPDMIFVWQNPFRIPKNFNPRTLSIDKVVEKEEDKTKKIKFMQLSDQDLSSIKVIVDGTPKKIFDIDWSHRVVMFEDETLKQYRLDEDIIITD